MNILITGGTGLLGGTILEYLSGKTSIVKQLTRDEFKFENRSVLKSTISRFNPDIVIHCAANTNVDACEVYVDDCFRVNVGLTEMLVSLTKSMRSRFVYISSTGVYGVGKKNPYTEYDPVFPTTQHHRSKYLAENIVLQQHPNPLVIRTGWLFGGGVSLSKNFVANRVREFNLTEGDIFSDNTQFGNPTWTLDVTRQMFVLLENELTGVFNCVNKGVASRFDYVSEIARLSGADVVVSPGDSSRFQRKAMVSFNESAINLKCQMYNLDVMPHWKERLAQYYSSIKEQLV